MKISSKKNIGFLFSCALLWVAAGVPACAEEGLLFEATFNEGGGVVDYGLKFSGNKNGTIVREDFLGSTPALKIHLHRTDHEVSYRTEVMPKGMPEPYFIKKKFSVLNQEYWYGVRIYLPEDWQSSNTRDIILQWHAKPDTDLGETYRSPPLALVIGDGSAGVGQKYLVSLKSDKRRLTKPKGERRRFTKKEFFDIGTITGDLGQWTDWVVHLKWSYNEDGFITLWKNREIVLQLKNYANAFNDENGPYWKLGIYKSKWKKPTDDQIVERVIYYDNIRVGSVNASFETVDPSKH